VGVVRLILLACVLAVVAAGCGPLDATGSGGEELDPVAVLGVLPSPDDLRGEPASAADPAELQDALTGVSDPRVAARIADLEPAAAGVRRWSAPGGRRLVAVVSVWDSHLTAIGIGGDMASALVEEGGRAWTPRGANGSRGARIDEDGRQEMRLSYGAGRNSLYVRAEGPVDPDVVIRTLNRLQAVALAQTG
jgi:hypothetical protein